MNISDLLQIIGLGADLHSISWAIDIESISIEAADDEAE